MASLGRQPSLAPRPKSPAVICSKNEVDLRSSLSGTSRRPSTAGRSANGAAKKDSTSSAGSRAAERTSWCDPSVRRGCGHPTLLAQCGQLQSATLLPSSDTALDGSPSESTEKHRNVAQDVWATAKVSMSERCRAASDMALDGSPSESTEKHPKVALDVWAVAKASMIERCRAASDIAAPQFFAVEQAFQGQPFRLDETCSEVTFSPDGGHAKDAQQDKANAPRKSLLSDVLRKLGPPPSPSAKLSTRAAPRHVLGEEVWAGAAAFATTLFSPLKRGPQSRSEHAKSAAAPPAEDWVPTVGLGMVRPAPAVRTTLAPTLPQSFSDHEVIEVKESSHDIDSVSTSPGASSSSSGAAVSRRSPLEQAADIARAAATTRVRAAAGSRRTSWPAAPRHARYDLEPSDQWQRKIEEAAEVSAVTAATPVVTRPRNSSLSAVPQHGKYNSEIVDTAAAPVAADSNRLSLISALRHSEELREHDDKHSTLVASKKPKVRQAVEPSAARVCQQDVEDSATAVTHHKTAVRTVKRALSKTNPDAGVHPNAVKLAAPCPAATPLSARKVVKKMVRYPKASAPSSVVILPPTSPSSEASPRTARSCSVDSLGDRMLLVLAEGLRESDERRAEHRRSSPAVIVAAAQAPGSPVGRSNDEERLQLQALRDGLQGAAARRRTQPELHVSGTSEGRLFGGGSSNLFGAGTGFSDPRTRSSAGVAPAAAGPRGYAASTAAAAAMLQRRRETE